MSEQWEFEKLRSVEDLFKADFRNLLSIADVNEALIRHHEIISNVMLSEYVDDDVKVQFEISRNLFLYSFFYYRFGMTSFKQAAAAAELGLRRYIGVPDNDRKNTLKNLLRRAHSQGLINLKQIKPHLKPEEFIEILTSFRNILAHGSHSLFPPTDCISFIQDYADILNTFYTHVHEQKLKPSINRWE